VVFVSGLQMLVGSGSALIEARIDAQCRFKDIRQFLGNYVTDKQKSVIIQMCWSGSPTVGPLEMTCVVRTSVN